MEELQNGTFAIFLCDVFSLFTRPSQYLEHLVVKILVLVFPRNNGLVLRLTSSLGVWPRLCEGMAMAGTACERIWTGV